MENGGEEATDRYCLGRKEESCDKSEVNIAAEESKTQPVVLTHVADNPGRKKSKKDQRQYEPHCDLIHKKN